MLTTAHLVRRISTLSLQLALNVADLLAKSLVVGVDLLPVRTKQRQVLGRLVLVDGILV